MASVLWCVVLCVYSSSEAAQLGGTAAPNRHYNGPSLNSAGSAPLRALSVSRNLTGTIPGTGTIEGPLLYDVLLINRSSRAKNIEERIVLFREPNAA